MVDAVRKHKRVSQVGIHRRSSPFVREAAEIVRSGYIGKVMTVRAFHIQNEWPKGIGNPPDENRRRILIGRRGWDRRRCEFNKNRTFYRFRWFWDYSGGQVTNFGVHYIDAIHQALGQDTKAVTAMGGKLVIEDNREVPDTIEVLWMYPRSDAANAGQFRSSMRAPRQQV